MVNIIARQKPKELEGGGGEGLLNHTPFSPFSKFYNCLENHLW